MNRAARDGLAASGSAARLRPDETLPEPWARHAQELAALRDEIASASVSGARARRDEPSIALGVACGASMTLFVATCFAVQRGWIAGTQALPALALALATYALVLLRARA